MKKNFVSTASLLDEALTTQIKALSTIKEFVPSVMRSKYYDPEDSYEALHEAVLERVNYVQNEVINLQQVADNLLYAVKHKKYRYCLSHPAEFDFTDEDLVDRLIKDMDAYARCPKLRKIAEMSEQEWEASISGDEEELSEEEASHE